MVKQKKYWQVSGTCRGETNLYHLRNIYLWKNCDIQIQSMYRIAGFFQKITWFFPKFLGKSEKHYQFGRKHFWELKLHICLFSTCHPSIKCLENAFINFFVPKYLVFRKMHFPCNMQGCNIFSYQMDKRITWCIFSYLVTLNT